MAGDHVRVNSIHDLASAPPGPRRALGQSQAAHPPRARGSRPRVNSFEAGKPTVELILVLRVLEALDLRLDVAEPSDRQGSRRAGRADLDALLDEYGQQ